MLTSELHGLIKYKRISTILCGEPSFAVSQFVFVEKPYSTITKKPTWLDTSMAFNHVGLLVQPASRITEMPFI